MSINIGDKPEMNVVNVGDELTQDQINAINAGQGPSSTNPFLTRTNTFNTTDTAVRITQTGTGEALRIEDSANPDTTPFIITADGRVGIGTTSVGINTLTVSGNASFTGTNTFTVLSGTAVPVTIQNNGSGNSFVVNDVASDTTPFVINNDGSVGIKRSTPSYDLDVNGTVNLNTLRFSDGTTQTTAPVAGYNPSTDIQDALSGAASPSASNVFATMADISGGGGGGGDFYSVDGIGVVVSMSEEGKVYQGTNGGTPTDAAYSGARIGFEYGGLNVYGASSGDFVYLDTTYMYWSNVSQSYPVYYSCGGISTSNSFQLPTNTYGTGSFGVNLETFASTLMSAEGGVYRAYVTDNMYTPIGSVSIGTYTSGYMGTHYYKTNTSFDGPNSYDSVVSDFTPVMDTTAVSQSHYIRIRINGVDYKIPAEVISYT